MDFSPLLHASPVIQIHAVAAMAALLIGAVVLFRRKGDRRHKAMGKVWVGMMAIVALSSFFIWTIRLWGLFSPIHLLSIFTLVMLWRGMALARKRQIVAHRWTMQLLYVSALIVTGLFTFYPGRIMYRVVFGSTGADPQKLAVFMGTLLVIAIASIVLIRWRKGTQGRAFIAAH